MALAGIYIDDKNQCQPVDENGKNLPDAYAAEMKLYKLCKIAIDGSDDGDTVSKRISDALSQWQKDDEANKKVLAKAEKEAGAALTDTKAKNREQEKRDKENEKTNHDKKMTGIANDPTLNPAQKAAATRTENDRHKAADNEIIRKKNEKDSEAEEAKKEALKKANAGLTEPPKLDVKCSPSDACAKDCKKMSVYPNPADDTKVKSIEVNLDNVSDLGKKHFYFCTCGKK